ncbi:RILP-like protein homolog isoform X2 [Daktulosphaira vitifoliae]|uniref:RILP-like protein homolog isoform X2 n=1 Tax=Daktulosphaira vitifoliae TaxID=58002 RepID=UPI0021AA95C6|nr:RILP-like protein homolog isoform X2 [Daktulosphaira vitifoliae]
MLLNVVGSTKMETYKCSLSVVDVYDIAQDIGREFEGIMDAYGTDAITGLMPKVVNALEQLEVLALKNERENTTVEDLRATIQQLERDKQERAEERLKYEQEMEQIEEKWREDYNELLNTVSRLQEDNHKLTKSVQAAKKDKIVETKSQVLSPDIDTVALQRLRSTVDQMRDTIRKQDQELTSKCNEVDSLSIQSERLQSTLKDLRRKHRFAQMQCRSLVEERADILAQLQSQQREFISLRQRYGMAQKENEDLAKYRNDMPDLKNKAIYDLDDPDRPKFTTNELKDILTERNNLKARVNELEDELQQFKPMEQVVVSSDDELEEGPVQGPLPLEPDDAPWKRSESGIRKFFRKMFGETGNMSFSKTSPKHSKLSLPKMAIPFGSSSILGPSEV